MTTPASGFLRIAENTGCTAYLGTSELTHAQETLTALLELLIKHTRPPLTISRLAGGRSHGQMQSDAKHEALSGGHP